MHLKGLQSPVRTHNPVWAQKLYKMYSSRPLELFAAVTSEQDQYILQLIEVLGKLTHSLRLATKQAQLKLADMIVKYFPDINLDMEQYYQEHVPHENEFLQLAPSLQKQFAEFI